MAAEQTARTHDENKSKLKTIDDEISPVDGPSLQDLTN